MASGSTSVRQGSCVGGTEGGQKQQGSDGGGGGVFPAPHVAWPPGVNPAPAPHLQACLFHVRWPHRAQLPPAGLQPSHPPAPTPNPHLELRLVRELAAVDEAQQLSPQHSDLRRHLPVQRQQRAQRAHEAQSGGAQLGLRRKGRRGESGGVRGVKAVREGGQGMWGCSLWTTAAEPVDAEARCSGATLPLAAAQGGVHGRSAVQAVAGAAPVVGGAPRTSVRWLPARCGKAWSGLPSWAPTCCAMCRTCRGEGAAVGRLQAGVQRGVGGGVRSAALAGTPFSLPPARHRSLAHYTDCPACT